MSHLLIVDDTVGIRRMLERQLKRLGYDVFSVEGGREALDLLQAEAVDLVLLDQMMPGMNGMETFEKIQNEISTHLPVIMITAQQSLELAVDFIKAGGIDFISKPIDIEVLDVKIKRALKTAELQKKMREQEVFLRESEKNLAERNAIIEEDLDMARTVQMGLLPTSSLEIPSIKLTTKYQTLDKVGGDFYDTVKLKEGYGFFVADVTGHGIPAAFLTALLKIFFQMSIQDIDDPAETLKKMSAFLSGYMSADTFVTAFYAIYHPATGKLLYAGAGHPEAILYKSKEDKSVLLESTGIPLGIYGDQDFYTKESLFETNDKLFIYTDGVFEVVDSTLGVLGKDKFVSFIENASRIMSVENVVEKIFSKEEDGFIKDAEVGDDITILALDHIG